jgi:DNA adenine methylase
MYKSPLRYPGGKSRAVKLLCEYVPEGTREILSPFFGGGSFELYCLSKFNSTIYGFDIYKPLVKFWRVLLENNDELVKSVSKFLPMVPEELYNSIRDNFESQKKLLDIARDFYILNRCSFSGLIDGGYTRYRVDVTGQNPRFNKNSVERLKPFNNIRKLSVGCCSFEKTLMNFPEEVYTYLDPPYLIKTKIYGSYKDTLHQIDHVLLNQLLASRRGPWMLSYNDIPEIRELYQDFNILDDIQWKYGMSKNKQSSELLILSHELFKTLKL